MTRKRVRRIVVDGRAYGWGVRMADENFISLRLWRDGDRVPMADVRLRFADPWLLFSEMAHVYRKTPDRFHEVFAIEPVRPRQIAELIRAYVSYAGPGRDFELIGGELRPVQRQVP